MRRIRLPAWHSFWGPVIQCDTTTELDMKTLAWTRGDMFPLDQLENRLKCPNCGSRQIKIMGLRGIEWVIFGAGRLTKLEIAGYFAFGRVWNLA
jgi:hypothetical protein